MPSIDNFECLVWSHRLFEIERSLKVNIPVSEKDTTINEELPESDKTEKQPIEVIHHKETEMNGIKVLPTCDKLDEPTQLDRNNKSFVDISTPEPEQGTFFLI